MYRGAYAGNGSRGDRNRVKRPIRSRQYRRYDSEYIKGLKVVTQESRLMWKKRTAKNELVKGER